MCSHIAVHSERHGFEAHERGNRFEASEVAALLRILCTGRGTTSAIHARGAPKVQGRLRRKRRQKKGQGAGGAKASTGHSRARANVRSRKRRSPLRWSDSSRSAVHARTSSDSSGARPRAFGGDGHFGGRAFESRCTKRTSVARSMKRSASRRTPRRQRSSRGDTAISEGNASKGVNALRECVL